ncbi:MAG TPA: hypothetical protein VN345_07995 [Blastocatellia bacterium]|nr:hypothetical protein [Blastocatellia bacterium]
MTLSTDGDISLSGWAIGYPNCKNRRNAGTSRRLRIVPGAYRRKSSAKHARKKHASCVSDTRESSTSCTNRVQSVVRAACDAGVPGLSVAKRYPSVLEPGCGINIRFGSDREIGVVLVDEDVLQIFYREPEHERRMGATHAVATRRLFTVPLSGVTYEMIESWVRQVATGTGLGPPVLPRLRVSTLAALSLGVLVLVVIIVVISILARS